jgi:hypothetical protein
MRIVPLPMVLLLAACALPPNTEDLPGPVPAYRKQIASGLAGVIGDPKRANGMQVSEPRQVDSLRGPAWLVCLRLVEAGRPRDYAVFFQNGLIAESRLAVRLDRCDAQAYKPFGVFADSLRAIH